MKTATLPSLRVEPELREAAQSVLKEGETLSSFMEETIRRQVNYRKVQASFLERSLQAEREAEETGKYYTADEVLAELRDIIDEEGRKGKAAS